MALCIWYLIMPNCSISYLLQVTLKGWRPCKNFSIFFSETKLFYLYRSSSLEMITDALEVTKDCSTKLLTAFISPFRSWKKKKEKIETILKITHKEHVVVFTFKRKKKSFRICFQIPCFQRQFIFDYNFLLLNDFDLVFLPVKLCEVWRDFEVVTWLDTKNQDYI